MLSEHLTMVRRDNDQGRVIQVQLLELVDHLPDTLVRVGDFTGIAVEQGLLDSCGHMLRRRHVLEARGERFRWFIREVRIIVMQKDEALFRGVFVQPLYYSARGFISPALIDAHGVARILEVIVIQVESLVHAESSIQYKGTHKCGCGKSSVLQ